MVFFIQSFNGKHIQKIKGFFRLLFIDFLSPARFLFDDRLCLDDLSWNFTFLRNQIFTYRLISHTGHFMIKTSFLFFFKRLFSPLQSFPFIHQLLFPVKCLLFTVYPCLLHSASGIFLCRTVDFFAAFLHTTKQRTLRDQNQGNHSQKDHDHISSRNADGRTEHFAENASDNPACMFLDAVLIILHQISALIVSVDQFAENGHGKPHQTTSAQFNPHNAFFLVYNCKSHSQKKGKRKQIRHQPKCSETDMAYRIADETADTEISDQDQNGQSKHQPDQDFLPDRESFISWIFDSFRFLIIRFSWSADLSLFRYRSLFLRHCCRFPAVVSLLWCRIASSCTLHRFFSFCHKMLLPFICFPRHITFFVAIAKIKHALWIL